MNLYLIANIVTFAGAFGGFLFGAVRFFRPKAAVYAQMITLASGCMAAGRLYQVIRILTVGDGLDRFHLGLLGVIGCLLFLLSANFGVMDAIADDGSKKNRRYRLIPLIAPLLAAGIWLVFFLIPDLSMTVRLASLAVTLFVIGASYYNLKHFLIPDVENGVIRCLRPYNLLALILEFLFPAEMIFMSRDMACLTLAAGILTGAVLPAVVISVDRGIQRWSN